MKRAFRCDVEVLSNNSYLSLLFQGAIQIIWNSLRDKRSPTNAYGVTCVWKELCLAIWLYLQKEVRVDLLDLLADHWGNVQSAVKEPIVDKFYRYGDPILVNIIWERAHAFLHIFRGDSLGQISLEGQYGGGDQVHMSGGHHILDKDLVPDNP